MRFHKILASAAWVALTVALASSSPVQAKSGESFPHLAGTLPRIEEQILKTLRAGDLVSRVIEIAADTNDHLTVAAVWFTSNGVPAEPPKTMHAYAWALAQSVLKSVPVLDEVDLTGLQEDPAVPNHQVVTFSAAISRDEFLRFPQGASADEGFHLLSRTWDRARTPQPENHSRNPGPDEQSIRSVYHGNLSRPTLAMTFDDGPFPIYTTLLLNTLARLGVKAAFFLVGQQVEEYPYFALAIASAGHEAENHTFHHVNLTRVSDAEVWEEIARAQETIATVTGRMPRYFRPPGGDYNSKILEIAHHLGLVTVFWTDNSADYTNLAAQVLETRVLARVSNGGIILFHQGTANTLYTLPGLTAVLRRHGYSIGTVSSLVAGTGFHYEQQTRRRKTKGLP